MDDGAASPRRTSPVASRTGLRHGLAIPAAAPHGGESLAALIERTGAWLAQVVGARKRNARGHARLGRSSGDCERARRRLLGLLADRCRAALACTAQRPGRTLESCGARAFGRPVVKRLLVALVAALFMLGTSPSHAHRISTRGGPPPQGVSIPSLTHGQMAVIGDNLPAIRALANAPDRFRHDDLAARGLSEPSILRLFLGGRSRQHYGRGQSVQRMRPRLSRRGASAPVAIARRARRRSQRGRGAHPQDRGGNARAQRFAHALPVQRRAVQHQRSDLAAWSEIPFHPPTLAALGAVFAIIASLAIWLMRRDGRAARLQTS